nr:MAG TPA: hypothetical protein [Caudoviricetes sp.]
MLEICKPVSVNFRNFLYLKSAIKIKIRIL